MLICRCGGEGIWDAPTDEIRCAACNAVLTRNRRMVADLQNVGGMTAGGHANRLEWLDRDGRVLQPIDGDAYSATLIIRSGGMSPDEIMDVLRRMAALRQPE